MDASRNKARKAVKEAKVEFAVQVTAGPAAFKGQQMLRNQRRRKEGASIKRAGALRILRVSDAGFG